MNIEMEQLELVKMLLTIRDKTILGKVKDLILSSHETGRTSIKQYNEELEAAEKRIDAGFFTTQEQLEAESKEW